MRERLRILARFADLLCDQKNAVASVITARPVSPEAESAFHEILVVLDTVKYLANHVPAFSEA